MSSLGRACCLLVLTMFAAATDCEWASGPDTPADISLSGKVEKGLRSCKPKGTMAKEKELEAANAVCMALIAKGEAACKAETTCGWETKISGGSCQTLQAMEAMAAAVAASQCQLKVMDQTTGQPVANMKETCVKDEAAKEKKFQCVYFAKGAMPGLGNDMCTLQSTMDTMKAAMSGPEPICAARAPTNTMDPTPIPDAEEAKLKAQCEGASANKGDHDHDHDHGGSGGSGGDAPKTPSGDGKLHHTLKGALTLKVPDADVFLADAKAKEAVTVGIATFLKMHPMAVSAVFSAASGRRLAAHLPTNVKTDYTVKADPAAIASAKAKIESGTAVTDMSKAVAAQVALAKGSEFVVSVTSATAPTVTVPTTKAPAVEAATAAPQQVLGTVATIVTAAALMRW